MPVGFLGRLAVAFDAGRNTAGAVGRTAIKISPFGQNGSGKAFVLKGQVRDKLDHQNIRPGNFWKLPERFVIYRFDKPGHWPS